MTTSTPKTLPTAQTLEYVIAWLEGGCDPKLAAKELRLLAAQPPEDQTQRIERSPGNAPRHWTVEEAIQTLENYNNAEVIYPGHIGPIGRVLSGLKLALAAQPPAVAAASLTKDEIQDLLGLLKDDHGGDYFESECPSCTAFRKLTAMLDQPPADPLKTLTELSEELGLHSVQPVAAIPEDPLDSPLPCDVTVGHVTIRKGVALRALVLRTQTLYDMSRPNVETLRVGGRFEPKLSPEAQALSDQLDRQAPQPPAGQQDRGEAPQLLTEVEKKSLLELAEAVWRDLQKNELGGFSGINRPFYLVWMFKTVIERYGYRDAGLQHSKDALDEAYERGKKDAKVASATAGEATAAQGAANKRPAFHAARPMVPSERSTLTLGYPDAAPATSKNEERCLICDGTGDMHRFDGEWLGPCPVCAPSPAAPVRGLPLTEAEIDAINTRTLGHQHFARAIEAAHGIGSPAPGGGEPSQPHLHHGGENV